MGDPPPSTAMVVLHWLLDRMKYDGYAVVEPSVEGWSPPTIANLYQVMTGHATMSQTGTPMPYAQCRWMPLDASCPCAVAETERCEAQAARFDAAK